MTDESKREDEEQFNTPGEDEEDGGLGNLPPLSDFDSADSGGEEEGGNLPPLGRLESDSGISTPGDLPPAGELKMDTPSPRTPGTPADPGGLVTPEFNDAPAFDTPTSDLDTPDPGEGFGFQDLAADSDFSPETPEIGPGPDSDVDTPLFDSAFGGDSGDFGTPDPSGTGAPTQAMETPMFDASPSPAGGGDFGFDNDAFGGAPTATPLDTDGGTPIPDFSPDTGAPISGHGGTPAAVAPPPRQKGGPGIVTLLLVAMITLIVGIVAGPYVADSAGFLPNPFTPRIDELERQNTQQQQSIARLTAAQGQQETPITQEELDRLLTTYEQTQRDLNDSNDQLARLMDQVQEAQGTLELINSDIEAQNQAYVQAEELLEQLRNDTEITRARHEGLLAENTRLTTQVGQLEEADARRAATKDALLHSLDRLIIQIESGIPLTPARFSRQDRIQQARALRQKVQEARWVTPELLNEYTSLYLKEMEIGASRDYFFARIPVHDQLGTQEMKWAECLMNGNWSVYYRTLDGNQVGIYEDTSPGGAPNYEFREGLPQEVRQEIAALITAARPPDYEEKFAVLTAKQQVYETRTDLQRNFDSL